MAMDFSSTLGHSPSPTAGNVGTGIMTGSDLRSLGGVVQTGATVIFASDIQTASWFNQTRQDTGQSQSIAATAGNSVAINFVTWEMKRFLLGRRGSFQNTTGVAALSLFGKIAVTG